MRPAQLLAWALAALVLIAMTPAANKALAAAPLPPLPLGIPVPSNPTLSDLLSTTAEGGDVHGVIPGASACKSAPHQPISLPADDAPHNGTSYIEWWWWTAHLTTAGGRQLAVMLNFVSRPWAGYQGTEYAITDLSNNSFHYGRDPLLVGQPKRTTNSFELRGPHSRATGNNKLSSIQLEADGYQINLSMTAVKPVVLGWSAANGYGSAYCNTVYDYSRPRMDVTGTLTRHAHTSEVRGVADFRHEWGFTPALDLAPWDLWNLTLNDGRDVFIVTTRVPQGNGRLAAYTFGTVSDRHGGATVVHHSDLSITPTRFWHRDASCTYPVGWNITIKGQRFRVAAPVVSDELRPERTPAFLLTWPGWADYWDGPTTITGDASGQGWYDAGHYCTA
jgi:predicted secreted hydrolase